MSDDAMEQAREAPRPPDQARSTSTSAATKLRYLRAAAALAASEGPGQDPSVFAVSRITMADVAADLGVARTTLYKLWPSKLQFWADLTAYIAATTLRPAADDVTASVVQPATADGTPEAAMERARVALNAMQARQLANPWSALRTALFGYSRSSRLDDLVGAANARDIDAAAVQLDRIFADLGLAPREPLTARDIAVAAFCLADGLAAAGRLSARVGRQDIVLDGEPGWGMLAFAVRALIRRCTRARTDADAASASALDAGRHPAPLDDADRWSDAQRTALAAGARRFAARVPGGGERQRQPSALGHLTLARLARHTGVSRQWLHRIWPTQRAFAADLIAYMFEQRGERVLLELRRATRHSMAVPVGGALVATEEAFRALTRFTASGPMSHLTYSTHDDDPAIRERCRVALESMLDEFAADLEAVTPSWGGHPRDGVTFFHLAAIVALTELAAARLERTNPGSVRTGLPYRGGEWSALAIMLAGVVDDSLGVPRGKQ